jgi:hypothetical protein
MTYSPDEIRQKKKKCPFQVYHHWHDREKVMGLKSLMTLENPLLGSIVQTSFDNRNMIQGVLRYQKVYKEIIDLLLPNRLFIPSLKRWGMSNDHNLAMLKIRHSFLTPNGCENFFVDSTYSKIGVSE